MLNIGIEAFLYCYKLTTVELGEGITSISNGLFGYCYELTDIVLPNNITKIGEYAFSCTAIKKIIIPSKVKTIGRYAFCSCDMLIDVIFNNTIGWKVVSTDNKTISIVNSDLQDTTMATRFLIESYSSYTWQM